MGRHGENIRKRKDGRWEGRYSIYSEEKGKKIYCSVYGRSYKEAKEKLTAQKILYEELPQKDMSKELLFTDVAKEWLLVVKSKKKISTFVKYSTIYHGYLEGDFQNVKLSEITVSQVREKISDSLSDSIQKSIYCVLNQILKFASIHYSLTLPFLKRSTGNVRKKPVEVLTKREQKILVFSLYEEMGIYELAMLFSLYTGLRLGEICALKWTDIDFENKTLYITRTVQRLSVEGQRAKTVLLEMEPKSECSKREIPLSDFILERLACFRNDKEYVFGGKKPMDPRNLQYHFKKSLKKAGLPDNRFHILRHTFATNCIEGGADVKSLSEILGHSDVQVTLNRYVYPSMEMKRKQLDVLSMFYGQFCGQTD